MQETDESVRCFIVSVVILIAAIAGYSEMKIRDDLRTGEMRMKQIEMNIGSKIEALRSGPVSAGPKMAGANGADPDSRT